MRNLLVIVLVFFFTSSFGQGYRYEQRLVGCIVATAKSRGFDLKVELGNFQQYLIANKVLRDSNGKSYYVIYKFIDAQGNAEFCIPYSFYDSLNAHRDTTYLIPLDTACSEVLDSDGRSLEYRNSKLYLLNTTMDSLVATGNWEISKAAMIVLRILSPTDFNQPFYKYSTLLQIAEAWDAENRNTEPLLPAPDNELPPTIKMRNSLLVHVTADNDTVYFNNRKVAIVDLALQTKDLILSDGDDSLMPELQMINIELIGKCYQSKLLISLENEKETKYDTYVKVLNQLLHAYELARNKESLTYFKRNFTDLNYLEKEAIKKLIPLCITEAEPKQ